MHKIAIGFTFYRQFEYSRMCLQSILDSDLSGIDFEIVLSNNECPDNSDKLIMDEFSDKFDNFKIIQNGSNKGCSGGWNAVINNSDSEYVWILNNDVIFHPMAIKRIAEFIEAEPEALVVSPAILEHPNPETCETLPIIHNKMEEAYSKFSGNAISSWSIISACAKKELYTDIVGLFDENFLKAFYEDCDFGNRCREKGVYGFTIGSSVNYHYGSRTVRFSSDASGNKKYFENKWKDGFKSIKSIETLKNKYNSFGEVFKFIPIVNIDKV